MEWIESIRESISYIEENITEDLSIKEIADRVNISPLYFQKGSSLVMVQIQLQFKKLIRKYFLSGYQTVRIMRLQQAII